ncbi:Permease [Candidatus Magnetomoraceae bacterium gMMP-1]
MKIIEKTSSCSCCVGSSNQASGIKKPIILYFIGGITSIYLWWAIYAKLHDFSSFLTYSLLNIKQETHLGNALEFFFYDTPKVMMLLFLVVFGVGIIRSFFTPEKTRDILSGKSEFAGNILAALLGIVTPFCSCSAVPLFIGFVTAGVPLGVTFSFLISAPMVNEIALALLYGLVGWKVAALYAGTGLFVAILAGWVIGRLNLEKHVEDWVMEIRTGETSTREEKMTWHDRIIAGWDAVKEIIGRVWIYVIIGIAVGAGIHGYVPEGFMASIMGNASWWSVPLSVIIGVPMYSNAAGIIPVVEALLGKGAALGSVLAFMMSVIALSLPEIVILRKVLKPKLIAVFIGVVASGILMIGYLFNAIL